MNKLLKDTFLYSIGEICPKVISFFLLPIYTKYLSPADYGTIAYTNTIMLFLFVLGSMSLNSFVLRYYFIWKEEQKRRKLIGSIVSMIILNNLVILLLAYLFLPSIIKSYDIQIPWDPYFKLAVIINFFDSFCTIPLVLYRVKQDALRFISLNLGKTFLQVILNLYFIVYLNLGLIGSYYASLLTFIPFSLIYIFIIIKHAGFHFDPTVIKLGLQYSLPLLPGALSYLVLSSFDRIILERNVPISSIGIYNVAYTLALSLNLVIQSVYKAIEPEIFKRYGTDDFYSFVNRAKSIYFSFIYVFGLIICLYSQEVFYYMTSPSFHVGYKLTPLLIVGVIMTGQNVIYSSILSAEKKTKSMGMATMIGASCSLIFSLTCIPIWGVKAAAISAAVSFTIVNLILFYKMTFPGKTMYKENICIVLIPVIAYSAFYFHPDISLTNILTKTLIISLYIIFLLKIYGLSLDKILKFKENKTFQL